MTKVIGDGIVETGSNANGVFEKTYDANGELTKQICTHYVIGGSTWTFPSSFPSAPRMQFTPSVNSVTARSAGFETPTATNVKVWVFNTPSGAQVPGGCHVKATWLKGA